MAGRIPETVVDEVRDATDIVDVVSSYVRLKRTGKNLKGLCPFHEEKTPSFIVSPDRQTFKCFGCSKGGNVFVFLMEHDRLEFPEAVRQLAERAGIVIPESGGSRGQEGERSEIFRALRVAAEFFHQQLLAPVGRRGLEYFRRRGVSDESIEKFQLGFAPQPDRWDALLRHSAQNGLKPEILEKAGLALMGRKGSRYDRFRDRVTFTIRDLQGRVVGFGARTLGDGEPKYLNSPETPVFSKSRVLYGLLEARDELRDGRDIAVGEGYTDVILAHQHGVPNIVATLGTALTADHAKLIKRFVDRATLVFDADAAGAKASKRGVDTILEADLDVRVAELPPGVDPCDLVVSQGPDALREAFASARDFFEFSIEQSRRELDGDSVHERSRMAERMLDVVRRVHNPVKRGLLIRRLAEELGVSEEHLNAGMRQSGRVGAPRGSATPDGPRSRGAGDSRARMMPRQDRAAGSEAPFDEMSHRAEEIPAPVVPPQVLQAERDLLEAMCVRADILARVATETDGVELFRSVEHRELAGLLFERCGREVEPDPEALLAEVHDPRMGSLITGFLNRERDDEEYEKLADGALAYFEQRAHKSHLQDLAKQRRDALARGDAAGIDALLRATHDVIRSRDAATTKDE